MFTRRQRSRAHPAYCICVYAHDAEDNAEVLRLLLALRGIGLRASLSFKTDAASRAGVYREGSAQRRADCPPA